MTPEADELQVKSHATYTSPHEMHVLSWGVLWVGYVLATIACAVPVFNGSKPSTDIEEQGERETSSGDSTRNLFYRLLFIALLSRTILMPVEAWAVSNYWQFLADTLPEICFASAWALLVSFFVQLVGNASGNGSFTKPGIVMQMTAYCIYLLLAVMYIWNDEASVLLFALLCCIYAALFATLVYFGPRLVALLRPSLSSRSGLAFRLIACCTVCILVFAARTVGLARTVVAPSGVVGSRWWLSYGVIELFPAVSLLVMMYPNRSETKQEEDTSPPNGQRGIHIRRTSSGSAPKRIAEQTPLLKPSVIYGASVDS